MEIQGYNIIDKIGAGGMATVYRATQLSLDRQVALKVMRASLAEDDSFGDRFQREAKIIAQLSHPHIIPIHDVGISDKQHYIAMEYQAGGDLKAKLSAGLSPEKSFEIVKQIASALDFAHQANYIHRDVKPANILFNSHDAALLSDFGVARVCGSSSNTTTSGQLFGTPMYMSPEQVQGKETDKRTDIYSLGVILYEMLMGIPPFEGDSAITVAVKHLTESPAPLDANLQHYQSILDKMLSKDRSKRWSSGSELVAAIDQLQSSTVKYQADSPIKTEKIDAETASDSAPASITRNSSVATWSAVASLGLIVAGVVLWNQFPHSISAIAKQINLADKVATLSQLSNDESATTEIAAQSQSSSPNTNASDIRNDSKSNTDKNISAVTRTNKPAVRSINTAENNFDRIKRQQTLALIQSADKAIQQKQWSIAEKEFREVLAIDKANAAAIDGLSTISDTYISLAEQAISTLDLASAGKHIKSARNIDNKNKKLAALDRRMRQGKTALRKRTEQQRVAQQRQQKLELEEQQQQLLAAEKKAQDKIINDLFTDFKVLLSQTEQTPIASLNEARQLYKTAITIDGNNPQIIEFKKQLVLSHMGAASVAISQSAYQNAKQLIDNALQVSPGDGRLLDYKNRIEQKIQTKQEIDDSLAYIDKKLSESTVTLQQLESILARYTDSMKISPANASLVNKKEKIINRYIKASQQAINNKDFPLAIKIATSGLKLEPINTTLENIKQAAANYQKDQSQRSDATPRITISTF